MLSITDLIIVFDLKYQSRSEKSIIFFFELFETLELLDLSSITSGDVDELRLIVVFKQVSLIGVTLF